MRTSFFNRILRMGAGRDVGLAAILLTALLCLFLSNVTRLYEVTHDVFHEMALAREFIVSGVFPVSDRFAFTPTVSPSVHHEWGTGVILYAATVGSGLGGAGLMLLKFSLIAALWIVLYRVARLRGCDPLMFATCAAIVFPLMWVGFATVRAQLFTLLFVAIQLWFQELDQRGRRRWTIAWSFMLVVWLNLHAGFVVGLGLMAFHVIERIFTAARRHKKMATTVRDTWHLLALAPIVAVSLPLNPYGWDYITYLAAALTMHRPSISEWLPLWHTHAPLLTLGAYGLGLSLAGYAIWQRRRRWWGATALWACAAMALKHIRHGSIFAVVWIAYVPAWLSHTRLGRRWIRVIKEHRQPCVRLAQAVAVASLFFATVHQFWLPRLPATPLHSSVCYPTGAVEYLREQKFTGNLLTPFHAGAYISWELYPAARVSLDGRYEVAFAAGVMEIHDQFFSAGCHWWSILDEYPCDAALVHQAAAVRPHLEIFRDATGSVRQPTISRWTIVYEDDTYLLLARQSAALSRLDRRGAKLSDGIQSAFAPQRARLGQAAKKSNDQWASKRGQPSQITLTEVNATNDSGRRP